VSGQELILCGYKAGLCLIPRLAEGQPALSLPKGGDDATTNAIAMRTRKPNKTRHAAGFVEDTG
jgi:hypothetical protein